MKFGNEVQLESNPVFKQVITNIANLHNNLPDEFCPALRALVSPELSYPSLVSLGMDILPDQYWYAKKRKQKMPSLLHLSSNITQKRRKALTILKSY